MLIFWICGALLVVPALLLSKKLQVNLVFDGLHSGGLLCLGGF